jgi:signal transduction histidine kinase
MQRAAALVGAVSGEIFLWDAKGQILVPRAWLNQEDWREEICLRPGEGVAGTVAARREGLIVNDYRHCPYALPVFLERTRSTAVLAEPLLYRDRLIGVIVLTREVIEQPFTSQDQQILNLFAGQAVIAIENARLYERVRTGRERLQRLSHRLVELQEGERRSIARELHDEIGQLLTGLKLLLEMSAGVKPEKLTPPLSEAQALVNELIVRVREMSLDLRPSMLDDLGLLPALLWHFERYTTQTNVRVNLQHSGLDRRFSPEIETAAYRIVQEALNNVARHARTPEVTVRIHVGSEAVDVQVEDKGVGFDPGAVLAADASIGLAGMRERAQLLGGHLAVESAPGSGTTVKAELPLGGKGAVERRRGERGA